MARISSARSVAGSSSESDGEPRSLGAMSGSGIVLGIFSIFQPWLFILYQPGFLVLLFSTLFFILWSHVEPKRLVLHEE